ncbi:MAG: ParB N-terminal domain-containing protein [Chloroflexi bacterium]|nr:ParB N-terminal domain-containing protein [Chloroflexota bacterium]MBP8059365.1 ParB N-terminal domain-containing protein [Chloroflexota bacterium]
MASKSKRPSFDTVMAFMSADTQESVASAEIALISLDVLLPDPDQPRRLLPDHLASELVWGRMRPRQALQTWMRQPDWPGNQKAIQLRRLADSIAQHGLINPITVRPPAGEDTVPREVQYLIVTGERRFWAHVLLALENRLIQDGGVTRSAEQIQVLVAPQGISVRAHQFIENFMREDINAVEKAGGLWALRYELSGVNHGSPQMDESELVPWARVEETLGISKRHRIYLTGVLELADEALQMVGESNLRERTIRPIVQRLRDWPDLQVDAINQLLAWQQDDEESGEGVTQAVERLVDELLTRQMNAAATPFSLSPKAQSSHLTRLQQQVQKTHHYFTRFTSKQLPHLAQTSREERQTILNDLESLRLQLDELMQALKSPQK